MIDETLLDDPDALVRADPHGLLRAVASAGAHVRTAVRGAEESALGRLTPEGRPGTVLVAGTGPEVPLAADLLAALAGDGTRVTRLVPTGALAAPGALTWSLPRWAGPLDLLVIASAEGTAPGLALLVESAYRRGCALVSVASAGSPLAEATAHRRSLAVPFSPAPYAEPAGHPAAPGPAWALITPLLLLGDRLGLFDADSAALHAMADRLDAVAERCGPAVSTHGNVAKSLAAECAAALPLLWSEGPAARAAARHGAATLTGLAGHPALTAELPEAFTAHGALLGGGPGRGPATDDFFRDRVEEPAPLHPRVVLLRSPLADGDERPAGPDGAAAAARELAFAQGATFSELETAGDGGPLGTAAELIAQLDFAAVYLTLAAARG
ncbi:SIS domain-containing protein [Streptomyces sp. MP131-18]|uniref:SIS domain-containing protein n=1 Tax=Streptomyces sp. MP131-18 TaxID=1857892 RepID=UPI00097C5996|nr:SIS domain-containing protein [Streptomyces sp. MP131-18]ONK13902.1 bifunctional phosphoglucose/phosphomannose isomerase [Streptomyces sp. MP131-18]